MSSTDAVPDAERLRQVAAVRLRRGRRAATAVALVIFFVVPLFILLLDGPDSWSVAEVAVLLALAVSGAVLHVVFLRWLGRDQARPQLLFGVSNSDQRAVQRALRTGRADDPRIDALARDTARHNLRLPWLYAVLAVVTGGLLVSNLVDGDWLSTATFGLQLGLWGPLTWQLLLGRRRIRRYLAGTAAPTGSDVAQP